MKKTLDIHRDHNIDIVENSMFPNCFFVMTQNILSCLGFLLLLNIFHLRK